VRIVIKPHADPPVGGANGHGKVRSSGDWGQRFVKDGFEQAAAFGPRGGKPSRTDSSFFRWFDLFCA
jgi:hypothetical protein